MYFHGVVLNYAQGERSWALASHPSQSATEPSDTMGLCLKIGMTLKPTFAFKEKSLILEGFRTRDWNFHKQYSFHFVCHQTTHVWGMEGVPA
jgi:hypothetical protein